MKAIRVHQFGGPEVMKWEDVPDPKPGPGQATVLVKAAGVNPVETYIRAGTYPVLVPLSYTPGADGAGIVDEVGKGVRSVKPGDRVYFNAAMGGSYAEKALVASDNVHPLPKKVTFTQGAAMGIPYGTAHRALFGRGGARKGETILVHGASGGVGTAAVQLAKRAKLTVIGTAGTDGGRALVKRLGAHHVLDHHDPDFGAKLSKITDGKGVDLILEMMANVNLGKDLTYLAKRGRVVVIGSRGPVEVNPRETMGRDADIRGMTLANTAPVELAKIHSDLAKGLKNGSLVPVIGREFALKDAPLAHVAVMAPGAYGKIVLIP